MLALANKLSITTQPVYKFVNKYSIDFDGVDDRIITDGADTVAQPTTYSFWCKSSETGVNKGVFGHGDANIGAFHFNFSSDKPLLYLGSGDFINWDISGDQQDDGEWHHWVVYSDTNDITNSKLYVDGVLQTPDSVASAGNISAYTESLTIGSDRQSGGNSFEGKIDEFAVYDRELTQAEITRMYNTYYSPNRVANGNFAQIGNEEVTNGDFSQIGSELVTNGDFSNGETGWSFSAECEVVNSQARIYSSDGGFQYIQQNSVFDTSKQYKLEFDVISSNGATLGFSSGIPDVTTTVLGKKTLYISPSSTNLQIKRSSGITDVVIDNVSVKEVGQDWSAKGGVITSVENGKLFFDNSTGNNSGGAFQNIGLVTGKQYQMTATMQLLTGATSGTFTLFTSSASGTGQSGVYTGSTLLVGGAAVTETFTFTPGSGDVSIQFSCDESNATYTISDISVKEVGQHWTFGTGWSMGDGVANATDAGFNSQLTDSTTLVAGKEYKVSFKVSNYVKGNVNVTVGNVSSSTVSANGSYTFNLTTSLTTPFRINTYAGGSGTTLSVDNIVVQELKHDATNLMLNAGDYQSANPLITSTKSMEFDGVDDYLQLSEPFSYTNHTITGWIKFTAETTVRIIFDTRDANDDGIVVYIGNDEKLYYKVNNLSVDSGSVLSTEKWINIACSYDGATSKIYLDGVLANSGNAARVISTTTNAKIGLNFLNTQQYKGQITEVGAFNRALTALEVASLYNQGMPTNLLVNRNNYQSGNPTVFNTKQVDFDGTDDYLKVTNNYGSFTGSVSMWFKRDNTGNPMYLIDARGDSANGTGYIIVNSSNFTVSSGTRYVDGVAQTTMPTDANWHHMVVTGITLDIDEDLKIGSRYNQTEELEGNISQVGLWNSTLTANEVSSLYNHGLPINLTTDQAAYASSSNLVGYWRMGSGVNDAYPIIFDQLDTTQTEIITNGSFATNSNWNAGNWTYIGNGFKIVGASGVNSPLIQVIPVINGKTYTFSYTRNYISGGGVTNVFVQTDGSNYVTLGNYSSTVVEEHTVTGTFVALFTGNMNWQIFGIDTFTGTVTNASVKLLGGSPAIMTNQTSSDIENGSPYANIVQNGTFETDSDWTKGTGISINNGVATSDGTSGNYDNILVGTISGTWNTSLYYVVSVEVKSYTSGNFKLNNATHNITDAISSAGTHTVIWQPSNANSVIGVQNSGTPFNGTIDNISVKEQNTGLQGYWKMGDGTNDEYPVIYDQTNPTLGSELVTNGDFATDSDWTKGTGWTISGGSANCDGTQSGNSTIVTSSSISGIQNKVVKFSFELSNCNSGSISATVQGTGGQEFSSVSENKMYNIYIVSVDTSALITFTANSDFIGSIDNVSIKVVQGNPATMTNMVEGNITNQYPLTKIRNYYRMGDGILDGYPIIQDQTSPNLAHIPTTNLFIYSEDFSQSEWIKGGVTLLSGQTSPIGDTSAFKLTFSADNDYIQDHITGLDTSKKYTLSFYAKVDSGTTDIDCGNIDAGVTEIRTITDEWVRYEITQTPNESGRYPRPIQARSASVIYLWGCQFEEQSQATAYIKSDGIAAVRKSSTTNTLPYSEDFSQASQLQNVTLTANAITSPTGTSNGTKVLSSDNNSKVSYTGISFTNGTTYTLSVYCKNIDATALKFFVYNAGGGDITDDFTSQVNTTSWTRVSTTFTASQTTSSGQVQFARNLPNGESAYFWGFQFEEQTQAETYAKTTGLPVTIDLFTENNYGTMTNMSASDIVEDTP